MLSKHLFQNFSRSKVNTFSQFYQIIHIFSNIFLTNAIVGIIYHTFVPIFFSLILVLPQKYNKAYFYLNISDFLLTLRKSLLCHTMELKDIMKQRREVLSLTQQDLAEMAQVGLATIKDIERGKGNPALTTVTKILEVLGIEIDYRVRQTI